MQPVYLSYPLKEFSGTREALAGLVQRAVREAFVSGARPELVLIASAHPEEFADVDSAGLARTVRDELKLLRHPGRVEYFSNPGLRHPGAHLAASATGAALFHEAARRIACGEENCILAVAAEQMRLLGRDRTTQVLQGLIHEEERRYGVTMPSLGALLEATLSHHHPGLIQALEELMFANRARAVFNPRAHIRKEFRRGDALGPKNPVISSPLRLWDVAPTSSGFAAIQLSSQPSKRPVEVQVAGLGQGHDAVALGRRRTLHRSAATKEALEMLLGDLGWQLPELRRRVRFAEIHDAFPVIEFLGLMDSGLFAPDEVVAAILEGEIGPAGRLPINQSGGVMGGHPVGATGLGQIVELYLQSVGTAGSVPCAPRTGYSLAFNVGGPLTYNFLTLLRARESSGLQELFWLPRRPPFTVSDFDTAAPPPLSLPCAGRLLARTELHVPPPGFEGPVHIGLAEVEGRARLVHCPRGFRAGTRVWLAEQSGRIVVRSGPGVNEMPGGPTAALRLPHPPR